MTVLKPRQASPELSINTLQGEWSLSAQSPENFTMIVFYRGLHCPICLKYLADLEASLQKFSDAGVNVIVVSSDDEARAKQTVEKAGLDNVTMGYGLTIEQAQQWG